MNIQQLNEVIFQYIPISQYMGVDVISSDLSELRISAPFDVNRNKMGSAFGGSVSSMLTIGAWAWVYCYLEEHNVKTSLVIQANQTQFLRPVKKDIEVVCRGVDDSTAEKFLNTLQKKYKARLEVNSVVELDGQVCAEFTGKFVARLYEVR